MARTARGKSANDTCLTDGCCTDPTSSVPEPDALQIESVDCARPEIFDQK